ncbi:MAG: glycosyltransferase family 2 protein [Candidatus Omnitrophica bacterium]|nr:glycosyltransferase family 2 protein [Candidatus Omnitrophota bacterium]MBU1808058.1 glycosyltransferase family 2 protein [Candidatus Omnitrophota bacterium]
MARELKLLSVVIPICNEKDNINELYSRLIKIGKELSTKLELVFVNDGSSDSSFSMLKALGVSDKQVKVVDLSRNFGHQMAIRAGIEFASGDAVAIMDADLQDPPEVVIDMIASWKEGYHVVYAIRKTRKEGLLLRFLYATFYRLLKIMANTDMPLDAGDFCLMDKSIVKILSSMPESDPFMRGLRSWVGYDQIGVEYDRQERFGGKTKYSFLKLFRLALDGLVSFSYIPLRLAAISGFVVSGFAFLLILLLCFKRMPIYGTTTITVLILFLGGVQLITIGILGEYIARIYEQSKKRPLFLVKEKVNIQ